MLLLFQRFAQFSSILCSQTLNFQYAYYALVVLYMIILFIIIITNYVHLS